MTQSQQLQGTRGRLLVVDDDPAVKALQADFREQQGFEVRTVTHGQAALAALNVEHFEVISLLFNGLA